MGFLFQILLNGEEDLEVSALPTPCGWREIKKFHNHSTGSELRFGAYFRFATYNAHAFNRLRNHRILQ